jgi:hypothetical protein
LRDGAGQFDPPVGHGAENRLGRREIQDTVGGPGSRAGELGGGAGADDRAATQQARDFDGEVVPRVFAAVGDVQGSARSAIEQSQGGGGQVLRAGGPAALSIGLFVAAGIASRPWSKR